MVIVCTLVNNYNNISYVHLHKIYNQHACNKYNYYVIVRDAVVLGIN